MSHLEPSPSDRATLGFLVGRFTGEGALGKGVTRVSKQVVGRWEVGGHFLSLAMTASYLVGEEVADVHHALAVVGVMTRPDGSLDARVFTDSGQIYGHRLVVESGRVSFRDRVPHEIRASEARKILVATEYGYEETLEVDRGGQGFERYSVVRLRRQAD
jgi:hypothetical protein